MANRDNHYEAAFEAYLRARGIPYVAVDEARRSLMADGVSIKSLDFIVSSPGSTVWLVDVKGRRFPSGDDQSRHYWKNWSTCDDLRSLGQWETLFGANFRGLFVFAYHVLGDRAPLPAEQLFEHGLAYAGLQVEEPEVEDEQDADQIVVAAERRAARYRAARSDAKVSSIRAAIEEVFGLPAGSVALCGPDRRALRGDARIRTLRKRWEES